MVKLNSWVTSKQVSPSRTPYTDSHCTVDCSLPNPTSHHKIKEKEVISLCNSKILDPFQVKNDQKELYSKDLLYLTLNELVQKIKTMNHAFEVVPQTPLWESRSHGRTSSLAMHNSSLNDLPRQFWCLRDNTTWGFFMGQEFITPTYYWI